jgi:hypothetical protein
MSEEELTIYLRLGRRDAARFQHIKTFLGLRNDTEVCRAIINDYWRKHEKDFPVKLEHFNLNPEGVMIVDKEADRIFQVFFNPNGVRCECGKENCEHKRFALSMPKVQKILRKKGWKGSE